MNSAFPRISHPVSSDRRRKRINGVFPTYLSTPEYFAVISFLKLLSHSSLFDSTIFTARRFQSSGSGEELEIALNRFALYTWAANEKTNGFGIADFTRSRTFARSDFRRAKDRLVLVGPSRGKIFSINRIGAVDRKKWVSQSRSRWLSGSR